MATKTRPYFILATKEGPVHAPWCVYFGDYDAETVAFEYDAMIQGGWLKSDLKRIRVGTDSQSAINSALARING